MVEDLRKKALDILRKKFNNQSNIMHDNVENLIQELRIYQIELEIQNEELRNTQENHHKLIEKYKSIFDLAPVGYLIMDKESVILEVNQTGANMFHKDKTSLTGKKLNLFVHPDYQDTLYFHFNKLLESKQTESCEIRIIGKNKTPLFFLLESLLIEENGQIYVRTSLSDITSKIKIQQDNLNRKILLSSLIDSIPEPIFYKDIERRYLGCNKAFLKLFASGSLQSITGKRDYEIFDNDTLIDHFGKNDDLVFQKKSPITAEEWIINSKNKKVLLETTKTPYKNDKNEIIGIIGIGRDITSRKKYEDTLLKTRDYYKKLFQDFPNPVWTTGLDMKCNFFNNAWFDFTGRTIEEEAGLGWTNSIHPDDIMLFFDQYKQSFGNRESFQITYRLKNKEGNYHYITNYGSPFYDLNGSFQGFIGSCYDIHSRRLAEEKLEKNSIFYRSIFDALSSHIAVLDENGKIISFNRAWYDFFMSFSSDTVPEGQNYFDTFIKIPGVDKGHAQKFLSGIRDVISGKKSTFLMVYQCSINDSLFWFSGKVTKFYNQIPNIIVVSHDNITERVQAEHAVRESEAKFRTLFLSLNTSIFLYDNKGRIILANNEAIKQFNLEQDTKTGYKALNPMFYDELKNLIVKSRQPVNHVINTEETIRNLEIGISSPSSDKLKWFLSNADPIFDTNNKLKYVIFSLVDITDRKLIIEELKKAKEASEKATKAKSEFLSNMSHEIRTPLNAIIGLTELVLKDNIDTDSHNNIKNIKFAADNLLSLINDILDFSKIEAGKIDFINAEFDLKGLLSNIKELFSTKLDEKNLEIKMNISNDIPNVLIGDKTRLSQILLNLLSNSVKFTHKGHIELTVKPIKTDGDRLTLYFSIEDTGIGIDKAKHHRIFKTFSQAFSDSSHSYGGTGLGLAITKKLVELQGGTLNFSSEINKGSKFWFDLSFAISKLTAIRVEEERDLVIDLKGKKTMLVEDNKLNQYLTRQIFKRWDMELVIAENGKEALDIFNNEEIDIILMDIQMPVMNGYEATRNIRENFPEPKKSIPIVALTADISPETKKKVYEQKMNDFLQKPFTQKELQTKLFKNLIFETKDNTKEINMIKDTNTNGLIDLSYLKDILGDDEDTLREVLLIFQDQIPEYLEKIKSGIEEKNFINIEHSSHKMKSSFSSMGIFEIAEKLAIIEKKSKNRHDIEGIRQIFNEIENKGNLILLQSKNILKNLQYKRIVSIYLSNMKNGLKPLFLLAILILVSVLYADELEEKDTGFVIVPGIFYTPETSWGAAIGAVYYFQAHKSGAKSNPSTISANVLWTLENQKMLTFVPNLHLKGSKFVISSGMQFYDYPEKFYGIGNDNPDLYTTYTNYGFRTNGKLSYNILGNIYAGINFNYQYLEIKDIESHSTEHYLFLSNFDKGTIFGLGCHLFYDSRDNLFYTRDGVYLSFFSEFYNQNFIGDHNFQTFQFDLRSFSPHKKGIFGFHVFADINTGDIPFYTMPTLGGPMLVRGVLQNRYRDSNLFAIQAEYRLPISRKFRLVFFAGLGEVFKNINDIKMNNIKTAAGTGIRYALTDNGINLRFDIGYSDRDINFYIGILEAF